MTQEEIIKLAHAAGFNWPDIQATTIEQRLERFASLVAATEREKFTNTQEFVTLPREVVERALKVLEYAANDVLTGRNAATELRAALEQPDHSEQSYMGCVTSDMHELAEWLNTMYEDSKEQIAALEQPQNHIEHHLGMVTAGWKLVPVEPTQGMLYDIQEFSHILPPRGKRIWAHMLDAAPKPPTVKESLTVEQPQAEQPAMTPIAQRKLDSLLAEGYTISGYSIYHEQKHQHGFVTGAGLVGWWRPDGMEYPQPLGEQEPVAWVWFDANERPCSVTFGGPNINTPKDWVVSPLYTRPQPKREPLTEDEIDKLCPQYDDPMRREMWIIGFKATHNIK